jgi:hypothetical protein
MQDGPTAAKEATVDQDPPVSATEPPFEPSPSLGTEHDQSTYTSQQPLSAVGVSSVWDRILSVFKSKLETQKFTKAARETRKAKALTHSVTVCVFLLVPRN